MACMSSAIASSSTFTHPIVRSVDRLRLPQQQRCMLRMASPHRTCLVHVANIGWGSDGEVEPPNSQDLDYDDDKVEMQLLAEKHARWQAREARVVPSTHRDLLEFFLTTEEEEMEFEVARCRPRLTEDFFSFLESEIGSLRDAVNKAAVEDMVAEIELLEKSLREGIEAYDKFTVDLTGAKERLLRIFCSRNKTRTLMEMAENGEIDRRLLALLDENIATALKSNEEQAAVFMEEIRGAVVKYIVL